MRNNKFWVKIGKNLKNWQVFNNNSTCFEQKSEQKNNSKSANYDFQRNIWVNILGWA
jgi:hypothetical protein